MGTVAPACGSLWAEITRRDGAPCSSGPRLEKLSRALPARHKLSEYAPKAKVVYIAFCRESRLFTMAFTASMPPPLTPQETMERNDPCWCRSGRKWKRCHLDRDKQLRPNINELLNAIGQDQASGYYCAHPDAGTGTCSGGLTGAHTIQKEGGLRAIAENGHVISSKNGAFRIASNDGRIIPQRDGIGTASTFPGFCNAHDAMFSPAEQKIVELNQQVALLLSYRAIAYEKLLKESALRSNERARQEADKGQPFAEQAASSRDSMLQNA